MNHELKIVRRPNGLRILLAVILISAISAVVYLVSSAALGVRTHTLPTGSVQVSVPYSKYVVGESISFTIKNNYNSSIDIINNCPSEPLAVYFQEKGVWVRKHNQVERDECPNEERLVSVKAGGSVKGNFGPWKNLFKTPGKYRIVAFVEYYNALSYQDIEVVGPAVSNPTATDDTTKQDDFDEEDD